MLLIGGVVWAAGGARRAAKAAAGVPTERACPVTLRRRRWLVLVRLTGKNDLEAIHSAFGGFVLAGDRMAALVQDRLEMAGKAALPDEREELVEALREALAPQLDEDGFVLDGLKLLGDVGMDDPKIRSLQRFIATECYRRHTNFQQHCPVVDLYLDAVAGRGDWSVECAPRAGAIVQTRTSVEILRNQDDIMEVTKDGASIVTNRSLRQMLAGE